MSVIVVAFDGIEEVASRFRRTPAQVDAAVMRALNKTGTRTRTRLARIIRDQVNLPASYLGPSAGRLVVGEKATRSKLEVRIDGRDRPTSLARFSPDRAKATRGRVYSPGVAVKAGGSARPVGGVEFSRLLVLNSGNIGLAVRTKGNARPAGAYSPTRMRNGMWLLYGPSVDQVLMGARARNGGAFGDVEDEMMEFLRDEFLRLMKVEID